LAVDQALTRGWLNAALLRSQALARGKCLGAQMERALSKAGGADKTKAG
jgi:hypothetical protein